MDTAYVICGKLGDVFSAIAIAQTQTRQPVIVTSPQYASALEGIPGIKTELFEGDWDDLRGAIKFAKKKFRKVMVPQVYGKEFPIKHTRPSFQMDQAIRCGVKDFYKTRLKIEREPVKKERKILLIDHSESSPFAHKDELYSILKDRFTDYEVVRSSELNVSKFIDWLKIYDSVSAIVTIDTAHLHFSSATNTPVFALTYDSPVRWRGSAWHPRFKFYCRYGDFQARKEQLVHELEMSLGGQSTPEIRFVRTEFPFAYNPSIIEWKGRVVRAYRYNPDVALWPTRIAIDDKPVVLPERLNNCSVEDGRLFIFNGKLHLSYNYTPYPVKGPPVCAIAYGELVNEGGVWRLTNHIQPQYGKNNLNGLEKNWVFFDYQGQIHAIYQCSPEQIVLQLNGDKVVKEHRSHSPKFSMGAIRGGTQPILYNGKWIRFFHTLVKNPQQEVFWHYHMGALLMDSTPPFAISAVSKFPIMSGDERYFHDWKFYKARCVLPYGAVPHEDGWRVSVGINDSSCADVIIKPEHLNI